MEDQENFKIVPGFWQDCIEDGFYAKMCELATGIGMFGICKEYNSEYSQFSYMIAVEKNETETPEGFVEFEMPSANWAIFKSVGKMPNAIVDVWKRIFSEWLPATEYELDEKPQLEVYPIGDVNSPDYYCEVWVPIRQQ